MYLREFYIKHYYYNAALHLLPTTTNKEIIDHFFCFFSKQGFLCGDCVPWSRNDICPLYVGTYLIVHTYLFGIAKYALHICNMY